VIPAFLVARFVVGDVLRARAGPFLKRIAEELKIGESEPQVA
jgi:hypothetical protein